MYFGAFFKEKKEEDNFKARMPGEDGDFPIELPDIVSSVHSNLETKTLNFSRWTIGKKKMLDRTETTERPAAPSKPPSRRLDSDLPFNKMKERETGKTA